MGWPLAIVAHRAHRAHRMHRVPAVSAIALVAAGGCAQILGIDDTSSNRRPIASLTVTRMSVGATVEMSPLDLTGLTATYLVASGAASGFDRVPAATGKDAGSWTAKLVFIAANAWDGTQQFWLDNVLGEPTTYTFCVRHEAHCYIARVAGRDWRRCLWI